MSKRSDAGLFGGIRHMAIAKKITLMYGGIFSISLLFISIFMALNISSLQQGNMRRELTRTVDNIQNYLDSGGVLNDETLAGLLENKYVEVSIHSLKDGKSYNSYVWEMPAFIMGRPEPLGEPVPPEKREFYEDAFRQQEREMRKKGFQVHMKKESDGGITEYILQNELEQQFMLLSGIYEAGDGLYLIQAFKMMDSARYMFKHFLTTLILVDFVGIFCAFLIRRYISRKMLRPVAAIRSAAERISIEDLSRRIPTEGPEDEMMELTVTFNSMIERLDTAFQRQNQFVSDASHELRTPIAVIQGYANLINRWGKSDPDVLQESIDSILTETEHMSALIRKLLFLAKSDQNRLHAQKEKILLNDVASDIVREMAVLEPKREVVYQEEAGVTLWADYDLMKQLLWIHGENAIKYTHDGGRITVRVWKDKKYGYVSIADDGVGIGEEDRAKIFDRFYRVDKSRNKEISGTGLGLAIARWIVECHDGEILLESEQGKGTVFTDKFRLYDGDSYETARKA